MPYELKAIVECPCCGKRRKVSDPGDEVPKHKKPGLHGVDCPGSNSPGKLVKILRIKEN